MRSKDSGISGLRIKISQVPRDNCKDNELKTLSLEQWKQEIQKSKKNGGIENNFGDDQKDDDKDTAQSNEEDEKDSHINDEFDDLILYLQFPGLWVNSSSFIAIISRLIRIYTGDVLCSNLYNDSKNSQLKGFKISMAIHPLNCDIYITDSQTIFKLKNKIGIIPQKHDKKNDKNDTKHKGKNTKNNINYNYNNNELIPIFRLPPRSKKLINFAAKEYQHKYSTSNISDICIDSNGKYLYYIINKRYLKIFRLNIDNISDDTSRYLIKNNDKFNKQFSVIDYEPPEVKEFAKSRFNSNFTVDKDHDARWKYNGAFVQILNKYNFCHIEQSLNIPFHTRHDDYRNVVWYLGIPKGQLVCVSKSVWLNCLNNFSFEDNPLDKYTGYFEWCQDELFELYSPKLEFVQEVVHSKIKKDMDDFERGRESKNLQLKNKNVGINTSLDDKNKNSEKMSTTILNGINLNDDDNDDDNDISAFTIDYYYNAIYLVIKNRKLYRIEFEMNNNNDNGNDNINIEKYTITHEIDLREELSQNGGTPLGFCVIRYDSVLGRLIIADNYTIKALYI